MMAKDYQEEVKKEDGLQGMEGELEGLRAENSKLRYSKEVMDRTIEN